MWKRNLHHLSVCHGFLHLLRNPDSFHHHVTARTNQTPLPRHLQYRSETTSSPTTQIGVDGFTIPQLSAACTCLRHKTRSEDANSTVDYASPPHRSSSLCTAASFITHRCNSLEIVHFTWSRKRWHYDHDKSLPKEKSFVREMLAVQMQETWNRGEVVFERLLVFKSWKWRKTLATN